MGQFSHFNPDGEVHMVNVGDKPATRREATASARVHMQEATLHAVQQGELAKGDVLQVARLAGIMAAKRTGELIPLCHPLGLEAVTVDFTFEESAIRVTASASLTGKTGVEMEAMVAVSTALLTIYDMAKAIDKGMVIGEVKLLEKRGGKSGNWKAPA